MLRIYQALTAEASKAAIFKQHPHLFHFHAWTTLDKGFLSQPIVSIKLASPGPLMQIMEFQKDSQNPSYTHKFRPTYLLD